MTTKSTLATLFADIAGSCSIYELLGDEAGRNLISRCLTDLRAITDAHGGNVVKTIGDEIMCTFPVARDAGEAAIAMQMAMKMHSAHAPRLEVALRIGFHFGQVVLEAGGDVLGDAVNVAARLAQYAKGCQIVTTWETLSMLKLEYSHRELDRVRLRNREQIVTIHEILWSHDETTTLPEFALPVNDEHPTTLVVQLGDQVASVGEENFKIAFGRDPASDIHVEGTTASRNHATLEYRRGTFVLSDMSTNATYVRQGTEQTRLHREQMPIVGAVQISLGVPFWKNPEAIVEVTPRSSDELRNAVVRGDRAAGRGGDG